MYSLFRLLFRSNYWRMVLRKATWVEALQSLRRAHKDKRARRHLGRLFLLLLTPALCIGYLAWLVGSGAWLFIPFVIPVIWWMNRGAKRDAEPLHVAPTPELELRELSEEDRLALRLYFAELAVLHAVMVDRAGSERFQKEKQLPEGVEVTSRRVHLDLLKRIGIWEKMAAEDREALMMPDGHWEWAMINRVALAMEPLRLFRWILRIDFYLPVVGQQLSGDFAIAHELVLEPRKALDGVKMADMEMMRVGRDAADQFFQRCLAETISRGYYDPGDAEVVKRAGEISAAMAGQQHRDFVLGSRLVSEAGKEELLWATSLAQRRRNILAWAMSLLEAGQPAEPPLVCVSAE